LSFVAFWLQRDRVLAAMSSNTEGVIPDVELMIRTLAAVDDDELADPSVELSALAKRAIHTPAIDISDGLSRALPR
jgi:3-phenylpropionate/trans-cinnamate dioxygenase ferredoxin reductase subunit